MIRIASMLVVALITVACTGASDSADTTTTTITTLEPDLITYESPALGFSIDYPTAWTLAENADQGILEVTAPAAVDGFLPNFNVLAKGDLPEEIPIPVFFESKLAEYRSSLPDVTLLEVADLTTSNGPARGITLTSTEGNATIAISTLVLVDEDDRVWEVTFFSAAQTMENLGPLVIEIFQSFIILH